jgi:hypothetical protein
VCFHDVWRLHVDNLGRERSVSDVIHARQRVARTHVYYTSFPAAAPDNAHARTFRKKVEALSAFLEQVRTDFMRMCVV